MDLSFALFGAAFLNGLTGSLHCVGMCGPLAGTLTLFLSPSEKSKNSILQLSYNSGRLLSYSLIGLLLGFLGEGTNIVLSRLLPFQEIAAWIGIFFLAVMGLYLFFGKSPGSNMYLGRLMGKLAKPILGELRSGPLKSNRIVILGFSFGLLTGLLPCGILYPAFITAFASGSPLLGSAIMVSFFLGTFPLLFAFGIGFTSILSKFKGKIIRIAGGLAVVVSILMIAFRFGHQHGEHTNPIDSNIEHVHSHHH